MNEAPERIWANNPAEVTEHDQRWWYENEMAFSTVEYIRADLLATKPDATLDGLIADLCDAAFECGEYDDSEAHSTKYDALCAAEKEAGEALKRYIATRIKEARQEAFKEARGIVDKLFHNSEVNHSRWNEAITAASAALERAATTDKEKDNETVQDS